MFDRAGEGAQHCCSLNMQREYHKVILTKQNVLIISCECAYFFCCFLSINVFQCKTFLMRKIDFILFLWYDPSFHLKKSVKSYVLCLVFVFEPSLWPKWKVPHTRKKQIHINTHNNIRISTQKSFDILPTPEVAKLSPPNRMQVWKQIQWIFIQVDSREVSSNARYRCAADFRIIRHFRRWIFDLITPSSSMRRKNLIVHF